MLALGLLKEELDAGHGGSGFSFADLMADRAGTEFARTAMRDRDSAIALQTWVLNEQNDLNQLMPAADDLPEGLSDAELQDRFDGVNGRRYADMLQDMEKRLCDVPWREAD